MIIINVAIVIPFRFKDSLELWMQKRNSKDELNDFLEFPGGKIEAGEDPKAAAIRETFEETGIILVPSKLELVKVYDDVKVSKTIRLNIFSYADSEEFLDYWYSDPSEYWPLIPPANQTFLEEVLSLIKTVT